MMFRFKALQKMREPDELDSPSLLAAPRGWIAVFVIMFVMAAAVIWAVVGSIPISVTSKGLLTYADGTAVVASPLEGQVHEVGIRPGQPVEAGQLLVSVETAEGTQVIPSPFRGRVVGLSVSDAQLVGRGSPLVTIERIRSADQPIVAMLFVPEADSPALRPGQQVELAVPTAPTAQYGLLLGEVSSVSEFPLTAGQVAALVGGDLAAKSYTTVSAPHLVLVTLAQDASTPTGYRWTTAAGPPGGLRSQLPLNATISIAEQSPITFLFGR
jgi:multidrug efflux pump subunit AcrA (membrane-fusion protein)